jgi:hypothetical protein
MLRTRFQIIRSQGGTGPTPTYNFHRFKIQSGQKHPVHSNCPKQTKHHNMQRAKNVHHFLSVIFSYHCGPKKNIFQLQPLFRQTGGLVLVFVLLEVFNARGESLRALSSRCKTKKQHCSTSQVQHTQKERNKIKSLSFLACSTSNHLQQ